MWLLRVVTVAILVIAGLSLGEGAVFGAAIVLSLVLTPIEQRARRVTAQLDPIRTRLRAAALARALEHVASAPAAEADPALAALADQARGAVAGCRRLAGLCDGLAKGANALRALLGALVCIEWIQLRRFLIWHRDHAADYADWWRLVGRVEAVACAATYAAEQGGVWAEAGTGEDLFAATALAHPLLPAATRVANDIVLKDGQVLLLTGANASGKSTFVRSLTLALIMDRAGLPICASACRLRRMRVATVMRVHDDLRAGRSRFQAEVDRLRAVLDLAEADDPAPLCLALDEILGGTNSRERHLGTQAIIDHLRGRPGLTLVTTHDLDLARVAEAEPERVVLAHFADRAALGEDASADVAFDYQLRPGVLASTNALRVMHHAGLPVSID
ncbi:MAG: MutS-related protein [Planctomycetota bacterium]